jgi:phosphoribosylaminoimidazole-succinocarboxamide synthase
MKLIVNGKTKSLFVNEETGEYYLFFKDDATGVDGVFDPGANTVGGSVSGKGRTGLIISKYFFELMEANGIPTQYLGADIEKCLMKVRKITVPELEFVIRYFTAGSMCRRFSIDPGIPFEPPYLETTLKDDAQGDPVIGERLCVMKGILREGEYNKALGLLQKVGNVLREELTGFGLTLIDLKIEIGFDENRNVYVADELTPDIWRVRDGSGVIPDQIECAKMVLDKINKK